MAEIPTFKRRIIAIVYDCFLVFALAIMSAAIMVGIRTAVSGPVSEGEIAISGFWKIPTFTLTLLSVFLFYGYFWTRIGQTLAMQTWRIKLVRAGTEDLVSWKEASIRFACCCLTFALLGLGYLWIFFDPYKRSLHDILSKTELILLPKESRA